MKTSNRRKIYYVPGMISLILLPILCIWFLNENYREERCMEIALPKYIPIPKPKYTEGYYVLTLSDIKKKKDLSILN